MAILLHNKILLLKQPDIQEQGIEAVYGIKFEIILA